MTRGRAAHAAALASRWLRLCRAESLTPQVLAPCECSGGEAGCASRATRHPQLPSLLRTAASLALPPRPSQQPSARQDLLVPWGAAKPRRAHPQTLSLPPSAAYRRQMVGGRHRAKASTRSSRRSTTAAATPTSSTQHVSPALPAPIRSNRRSDRICWCRGVRRSRARASPNPVAPTICRLTAADGRRPTTMSARRSIDSSTSSPTLRSPTYSTNAGYAQAQVMPSTRQTSSGSASPPS